MWVVKPLRAAGHDILVVDDDPTVIAQLERSKIPCLRGDGANEKTLEQAGARNARLIIASMRRLSEAEKVIQFARGVTVVARVFEAEEAEEVRRLGGTPVLNSKAGADEFMAWFNAGGWQRHPETAGAQS